MLRSADAIIDALGGTTAAAELAGVSVSAVSNWRERRAIPADNFLSFSHALDARGLKADPLVFGLKPVEARA